jgi:hypothetical protein
MAHTDRETYSVLRHGGASKARACVEMGVSSGRGLMLEAVFRCPRPGKGGYGGRPRFALHATHVDAVRAAGGYPAMALR